MIHTGLQYLRVYHNLKIPYNKIKDGNQRLQFVLITTLSPLKMINICNHFLAFVFLFIFGAAPGIFVEKV